MDTKLMNIKSFISTESIMDFLYFYTSKSINHKNLADSCQVNRFTLSTIIFNKSTKTTVASITFETNSGVPIFNFVNEYKDLNDIQNKYRKDMLKLYFGHPLYDNNEVANNLIFIGTLSYRETFNTLMIKVDVFLDRKNEKLFVFKSNGSYTVFDFWTCVKDHSGVETHAIRNAWAVLNTKNWD